MQEPDLASDADSSKLTTMLLAMADVRAVLVNLAARLHQLRGLASQAERSYSAEAMAEETLRVFAPLANRLGVWSLKAEMEDLCFQVRCDEQLQGKLVDRSLWGRACCAMLLTFLCVKGERCCVLGAVTRHGMHLAVCSMARLDPVPQRFVLCHRLCRCAVP